MDFNKKIKIGIMGCASIAEKSAIPAIKKLEKRFELVAIASRSFEKAQRFANLFNCIPIHGYENLLDLDIDAVYIPLPTGLHHEWIIKSLEKGLHVYAEKSIAINLKSALEMVNLAKLNKLALMEGYMFQYHPQHKIVKKLIKENKIGEIRSFKSSFGFSPLQENNFRYNVLLGGGSLLDAGGYTLRSVSFILEDSFRVVSSTLKKKSVSEVDIFGSAMLINNNGVGAHIAFGFDNYYQCSYEIWGSLGKIIVPKAFTPKKDEQTFIHFEKNNYSERIKIDCFDQFEGSFISFHEKIFSISLRDEEYSNILMQSNSLDEIRIFSESN